MWQTPDVIILSDLHLAAERGCGLFRADLGLAQFFNWVREETGACTVVLAGDIFDFLVTPAQSPPTFPHAGGKYTFDLQVAAAWLASIFECHPEVFDALARLAQSSRHQLVILGGNHDPEVVSPEIQRLVEARLGLPWAAPRLRWLTNGEALRLQVGRVRALIEHGELYDPWNRLERASLNRAAGYASRGILTGHAQYQPPPGSTLVVDYVAAQRQQYPWLDALKPEREAVFPLLREFSTGWDKVRMAQQVLPWLKMQQRRVLAEAAQALAPSRIVRAEEEADTRRQQFNRYLRECEMEATRGVVTEQQLDKLMHKLRPVVVEDRFFQVVEEDNVDTRAEVTVLLAHGADAVIHGHTHAAKCYPVGRGLYLNSGTWGQLLRLPPSAASDDEWRQFLLGLSEGRDESFARPTFVRLTAEAQTVTAELCRWNAAAGKPEALARQQHCQPVQGWETQITGVTDGF